MQCGYPKRLLHKLYLRKGQCFYHLKENDEALKGTLKIVSMYVTAPKVTATVKTMSRAFQLFQFPESWSLSHVPQDAYINHSYLCLITVSHHLEKAYLFPPSLG